MKTSGNFRRDSKIDPWIRIESVLFRPCLRSYVSIASPFCPVRKTSTSKMHIMGLCRFGHARDTEMSREVVSYQIFFPDPVCTITNSRVVSSKMQRMTVLLRSMPAHYSPSNSHLITPLLMTLGRGVALNPSSSLNYQSSYKATCEVYIINDQGTLK